MFDFDDLKCGDVKSVWAMEDKVIKKVERSVQYEKYSALLLLVLFLLSAVSFYNSLSNDLGYALFDGAVDFLTFVFLFVLQCFLIRVRKDELSFTKDVFNMYRQNVCDSDEWDEFLSQVDCDDFC